MVTTMTTDGRQLEIRDDVWVFSDTGEKADPVTLMLIDINSAITAATELRSQKPENGRILSIAITHLEDAMLRLQTVEL